MRLHYALRFTLSRCVGCIETMQEAGLLAVPEVRDSLGLSEASCTTLMHLLADT